MSHIFQLGLEGQTALNFQSLFDAPTTLVTTSATDSGVCSGTFVFEDEGDVFQCGRCKRQFGSLTVFMMHKREGCAIIPSAVSPIHLSNGCLKTDSVKDSNEYNLATNGHYMTDGGEELISDHMEQHNNGQFDNAVLSALTLSHQGHDVEHGSGIETAGDDGMLRSHPNSVNIQSIVLTDDTMSLTIPVDQNSQLGQLISSSNSQTVLHIPESELAALIAGERFHISASTDPSNSMNSQGFFLTASVLPSSNVKEPLSEKNQPANHSGYDLLDGHLDSSENYFHLKKDTMLIGSEGEVVSRFSKATSPMVEESGVLRIRKEKVTNSNRENTQQQRPPNRSKVSKSASVLIKRNNGTENNSSTPNQKPSEAPEAKRKCEYCGKPFKKLFNLHQHIRSHTGEKPFHCLVCGRGFTQKSNVKKHMQTHKVWPKVKYTLPKEQISMKMKEGEPSPVDVGDGGDPQTGENVEYIVNNVYVCQYCDQHFENYHKLKTHLSHTHKNEKLFKCIHKDCMATFTEVEGLISHMKSHEDQIEYQCQKCDRKFKNLYDLGAHQYSHTHRLQASKVPTTPPKQFRCTKCNSKYASAEALNHHLLTSSHNYPCSQCQLTFVCERYLRRHLRIHGTVEPFKCDLCGKMFKTENYLKSHLVIHSDSKPFCCEICKQSFNRRDKLTRHKLMHDNRKKYKCPYKHSGCEREFYRKDKLKDHLLSHSRKVFSCSKCGKNFSWPVRLRKHQATFHPEMLSSITCPTCQKIFKTKHHLKIHACKALTEMEGGLHVVGIDDENLRGSVENNEHDELAASDNLLDNEALTKVVVLYNDCEIEDSINSNEEKCGPGVMLGSFTHTDDPETVIFTRYASDLDDKEGCTDLVEPSDDGGIGPIEMTFETGVDGHIDQLIVAD